MMDLKFELESIKQTDFHKNEAKRKEKKNLKKKIQNGWFFKIAIFQNPQFSKFFCEKLVGLIDAKGIDVAQPIWLWGCLT